jgi:tetratricopeptide (TPR) repeat protein
LIRLIAEKAPLFALALAAGVVTILAQRGSGALHSLEHLSVAARLGNALSGYGQYLALTIWPRNLSPFYPLRTPTPWQLAGAAAALLALAALALAQARRRPYLLVGWLWFLGTLVPVIGVVQVGPQALADRYTYVPHIGLFLLLVWGGYDLLSQWRRGPVVGAAAVAVLLAACVWVTWRQVQYWRNPLDLSRHALQTDPDNYLAHNILGMALLNEGQPKGAAAQFEAALRSEPGYALAHNNLGVALARQRKFEEAEGAFAEAVRLDPALAEAYNNLGQTQLRQGKVDQAASSYQQAVRLRPDQAVFRCNLALALQDLGSEGEARDQYREASRLNPDWPQAANAMAWVLATDLAEARRDGPLALQLARQVCAAADDPPARFLDTLAAAYAEMGRFDDAVQAARRALAAAEVAGESELTREIQERLQRYENRQAFRQ